MATETQTATEEMSEEEEVELAELLCSAMNAEQLRRFAHHHNVPRTRGDRKLETALKVVRQNLEAASRVDLEGDFVVYCAHCGTRGGQRFQTQTAEIAVEEARNHKSQNRHHFPIALDIRDEEDVEKLYG